MTAREDDELTESPKAEPPLGGVTKMLQGKNVEPVPMWEFTREDFDPVSSPLQTTEPWQSSLAPTPAPPQAPFAAAAEPLPPSESASAATGSPFTAVPLTESEIQVARIAQRAAMLAVYRDKLKSSETAEAPELEFDCEACGKRLTVPAYLAGISGFCPSCRSTVTAPTQQPPVQTPKHGTRPESVMNEEQGEEDEAFTSTLLSLEMKWKKLADAVERFESKTALI